MIYLNLLCSIPVSDTFYTVATYNVLGIWKQFSQKFTSSNKSLDLSTVLEISLRRFDDGYRLEIYFWVKPRRIPQHMSLS